MTGGRLCLDLANTLERRRTDRPRELLLDYARLLEWGLQAGTVTRADARRLRRAAAGHSQAAAAAVDHARDVRDVIFRVFSAVAGHRPVEAVAIDRLGQMIARLSAKRRLTERAGAFEWTWPRATGEDLDCVLWPVVWSATDLLTGEDRDRVRECQGPGCAWLFIDTSKNHSRRWCDMAVCGNRAKAARFRNRLARDRHGDDTQ